MDIVILNSIAIVTYHTLGATSKGAMDAANLLKPMLSRGELQCIGATTLEEYRKHIEKDAALERRFQQVYVDQPSVDHTITILRGLNERYEQHHGVRISDLALVAAARLSDRYISGRFLPDKGNNCYFKINSLGAAFATSLYLLLLSSLFVFV